MRAIKLVSLLFTLFILVLSLGFLGSYLAVGPQIPDVNSLKDVRLQTPMRIYDNDGQLIQEFGGMRRIPLSLSQVPEMFINALIATEDQRFYEHSGVDFMGVGRAALNLILTGRKSQGASTITMLVARNYFLTREQTFKRKITEVFLAWKIEDELSKDQILELLLNKIEFGHRAMGLGAASQVYYGKTLDELSLPQLAVLAGIPKGQSKYNPISYPKNAFARRNHVLKRMLIEGYINQEVHDQAAATPIESNYHASLAAVAAPYFAEMVRLEIIERFGIEDAYNAGFKIYTTLDTKNQQAARKALRDGLIAYEYRHGFRGPEDHIENHLEQDEQTLLEKLELIPTLGGLIPAIVHEIKEEAITVLLASGEKHEINFEQMQWAKPYLSEDRTGSEPEKPEDIVKLGDVIRVFKNKEEQWALGQIPEVNGALVAIDSNDGAIRALVGGFDFDHSKYNRAVQAKRQPGSNFKPFIYSAALEKGFTAASIVNDSPITMEDAGEEGFWRPKNAGDKYKGDITLRDALSLSVNSVSIRLISSIGIEYTRDYLTKFGFDKDRLPAYRSLALGAADHTPLEIASAYAIIANGGYRIKPYFIKRVTDSAGNVLFESEPQIVCRECETKSEDKSAQADELAKVDTTADSMLPNPDAPIEMFPPKGIPEAQIAPRVIEKRNNYILTNMMQDVIKRGTGRKALALKRDDLAGKTGTTNDTKDAWFSGFTRDLAVSTWVGFDDSSRGLGRREYGSVTALPIWIDFMREALVGVPEHKETQPEDIVMVKIDTTTGELATSASRKTRFEMFRIEFAPQQAPVETEVEDEEEAEATDLF